IEPFMLSLIANTHSIAVIMAGFFVGKITKTIGNNKTLILGSIFALICLILYATSDFLIFIFLASLFSGTADVIINASSYTIASKLIPPEKRAKLFGVYNTTFFLSWGVAGTLITGPLIDTLLNSGISEMISYRMAFWTGSLLTIIGLLIFVLLNFKIKNKK
ncbi:MAG: MFS transporter, partial [archaeon]|nr:MFS transporter [archaeon]